MEAVLLLSRNRYCIFGRVPSGYLPVHQRGKNVTPLEYKERSLPLPVKAMLIIRELKKNSFVKVTVFKIHKKTCDIVFEHGCVASMGIPHDDLTQIGEVD